MYFKEREREKYLFQHNESCALSLFFFLSFNPQTKYTNNKNNNKIRIKRIILNISSINK